MNKAYVVLKKGFEYDDNIYNEPESGGGNPQLVLFSKEDAVKKVQELNIEEFKQISLNNYSYDLEDILNVRQDVFDSFNQSLIDKYGKIKGVQSWDSDENRLHPMADDVEALKYLKMVSIEFYTMVETNIDLQSYRDTKIDSVLK